MVFRFYLRLNTGDLFNLIKPINMKKLIAAAIMLTALNSVQAQNAIAAKTKDYTAGKKVTVYTTADSGNLRFAITGNLNFTEFKQPVETQTCIFVDPSKTFQTFLGIGGALTD